ncbi:uncharacterized protein TNCV_2898061 [Trichonephila clavipes]|nr:uncharacterized protein TNCV_2898061 [Trichonephila clavipes]
MGRRSPLWRPVCCFLLPEFVTINNGPMATCSRSLPSWLDHKNPGTIDGCRSCPDQLKEEKHIVKLQKSSCRPSGIEVNDFDCIAAELGSNPVEGMDVRAPVPLKTRRVGQRCTLNLSRAETSSRWCGVVVREAVPAQVSSTSLDHGSKLRGPSPKPSCS